MVSFPIFNNLILGTAVSRFMAQFQNQVSTFHNLTPLINVLRISDKCGHNEVENTLAEHWAEERFRQISIPLFLAHSQKDSGASAWGLVLHGQ